MIEPLEIAALVEKFASGRRGKSAALKYAIRQGVTERVLRPNDELPSTRRTAAALSMSRNSVIDAYEGLQAEGVIETRRGARPRVCALPSLEPTLAGAERPITLSTRGKVLSDDHRAGYVVGRVDAFSPGLPDPALFPRDDWAVALRRAARRDLRGLDHYEAYQGLPALRTAVALHLKRHRGVSVAPEQVFILPNTQSGMALLCDLVTDAGDQVLVEDPGYAGARALFAAKGLEVAALPERVHRLTDGPGGQRGAAPEHRARLIYITPSTQYPTGNRMQLRRRADILAVAEARNALVIEDDYDGDFVWRGADVPPVFALDRAGAVALLGTLSKSIMPGMRMGWLVVPPRLIEPVQRAHRTLGLAVNVSVQAAMADFLTDGLFARHLRSAARTYRDRMATLTAALRETLGEAGRVSEPDGGLQVLLRFADHVDDVAVAEMLWDRGYELLPLSRLCLERRKAGLVIGFARANAASSVKLGSAIAGAVSQR